MAARKASGPACDCGQVVFDLTGKKPGAVLRCPWCHQRYRLQDDGSVDPVGDKVTDSTARVAPVRPSTKKHSRPSSRRKVVRKQREGSRERDDDIEDASYDVDDGPVEENKTSSSRRGIRKRREASEDIDPKSRDGVEVFRFDSDDEPGEEREGAAQSTKRRAPVRSSARSPGPAIKRREKPEEVLEEEGGVEVFRFESDGEDDKDQEATTRQRGVRRRDIASEPTDRQERISRRRTRKLDPVNGMQEVGEDGLPVDELPPVKPIDMEKWVVRMFLGMIPLGTLFFMIYVFYGVITGERDFVKYKIFGIEISGNNPWVWLAGVVLGGLVFLGLWVGYVYVFVHKKKLAEMEEERRKGEGRSSRRSSRGSRRMEAE